jgi:hypothetical protein
LSKDMLRKKLSGIELALPVSVRSFSLEYTLAE